MVTGAYHPEITGGSRQCQTLIQALRHSASISVLSVSNTQHLPGVVEGVTIHRIRVDPTRSREKAAGALGLAWILLSLRDDVGLVHLHGFTQKSILIVALARLLRKPLILKLGGIGMDDPDTIRRRGWLFWRL